MTARTLAFLIAVSAAPSLLRAQDTAAPGRWRVQGGGGIRHAVPVATMAGYLGTGQGIAASWTAARPRGALRLAGDAEYVRFGDHMVSRPYNGTGPAIAITSAATVLLVGLGPGLAVRTGPLELGVHAAGGAGWTHAAARTAFGTTPQTARGNSWSTLTWQVQGGAGVALRLAAGPRAARLALSGRIVHLGTTKFLREYNLPIGTISGLYPNPTPYAPTFAVFALTATAPL